MKTGCGKAGVEERRLKREVRAFALQTRTRRREKLILFNSSMEKRTRRGVAIAKGYFFLEILVLGIHYILMLLEIDTIFRFFDDSILLFIGIGVLLLFGLLLVKRELNKKEFQLSMVIVMVGIISPVLFIFCVLSQLH